MAEKSVEIIAVAHHGNGIIAHTTAGRLVLSDEALKKFGLAIAEPEEVTGRKFTAYNMARADAALVRTTADSIRVVALMLRERLSLFAACNKLGVPYGALTGRAAINPDLKDLFEAAKENSR